MPSRARQFIVHPAGSGYGLRVGPLLLPWLPASVLFAMAGLAILSPVAPDTWLALVGGRETVRHGLPAHDALSTLAAGRDWIDQAWLGQVTFYAAYALGGLGAVAVAGRIATTAAGVLGLATAPGDGLAARLHAGARDRIHPAGHPQRAAATVARRAALRSARLAAGHRRAPAVAARARGPRRS